MKIFSTVISIYLSKIILVLLFLATITLGYLYYTGNVDSKHTLLFGGLVAGLIVAIIQFLFSWNEHHSIEKINALGIKDILLHRENRSFYTNLISTSEARICVMGVTASRFMDHFADEQSNRPETRVLLDALSRKVQVRILVPERKFLKNEDDKGNFNKTKRQFQNVASKHKNFKYRYFSHLPAHSLVVVDEKCIIGPVFPKVRSKDTPCIFISTSSPYAKKYLEYLDTEWKNAKT